MRKRSYMGVLRRMANPSQPPRYFVVLKLALELTSRRRMTGVWGQVHLALQLWKKINQTPTEQEYDLTR